MITALISLFIIVLLYWAAISICQAANMGEPLLTIIRVVAVLAAVFVILNLFGLVPNLR